MKKGRFAKGPAEPRGFDSPWVDRPEGLLVELEARYASWSDFDMSEDAPWRSTRALAVRRTPSAWASE